MAAMSAPLHHPPARLVPLLCHHRSSLLTHRSPSSPFVRPLHSAVFAPRSPLLQAAPSASPASSSSPSSVASLPPPSSPSPFVPSSSSVVPPTSASSHWRVYSTPVDETKPLWLSLQSVYGVGLFRAREICGLLGLNPHTKTSTLGASFTRVRAHVEAAYAPRHVAEKVSQGHILDKVRIGSYQGIRHAQALPVRGQRTQTNAKTQKKLGKQRQHAFNVPTFNKKKPPPISVRPVLTTHAAQEAQGQQRPQMRQQSAAAKKT